jgi:hypothetical protein
MSRGTSNGSFIGTQNYVVCRGTDLGSLDWLCVRVPNWGARDVASANILRGPLVRVAYLVVRQGVDWPLPESTVPSSQGTSAQTIRARDEVGGNRKQIAPRAHVSWNIGRNRRELLEALCATS